jgi:hypothetical protein
MGKGGRSQRNDKQGRQNAPQFTRLSQHQKEGSVLHSPWKGKMPSQTWNWSRDLLPEYLWIAAVVRHFGKERAYKFYYKFMDAIDTVWPEKDSVALGLMTDFAAVPQSGRERLWEQQADLMIECFHKPIARVLSFYPENPAAWLIDNSLVAKGGHLDPDVELGNLRHLIEQLHLRHGDYATTVQALAFGRLLHHRKVQFGENVQDVIPILEKYPVGCTEPERLKIESMIRSLMGGLYLQEPRFDSHQWPKYFWRHNLDLSVCRPVNASIEGSSPLTPDEGLLVHAILQKNARRVREYVDGLSVKAKYDLYDPERDEILLGLFARISRLYILMVQDPNLWARDMANIHLRCLADTVITFGYLTRCGKAEDFEQFRKYGEGQQKLLMLHLQDSYPGAKALDGRDAQAMADELGRWAPEFMDIELGHWCKKDTRHLAKAAGMERLYSLVYGPTSGDLHGSWISLKHSNLCHCAEPLHRFHRMPTYSEPPMFIDTIMAAQELFLACLQDGIDRLGFPALSDPLEALRSSRHA